MERVVSEGQVATAATYAHMFSSLPNCGRPTRLMVYDLHTLQNRFYLVSPKLMMLQLLSKCFGQALTRILFHFTTAWKCSSIPADCNTVTEGTHERGKD